MPHWFHSVLALSLILAGASPARAGDVPTSARFERVAARVTPRLEAQLRNKGLEPGAPIYLRLFKEERQLELWVKNEDAYQLFKTYYICAWSGRLGPKEREGDGQSPEGFYRVMPQQMNPASSYHLSFNLGFPNTYDRAHGRTGSFLMIHGSCVSVGCYAMTNKGIEEIYTAAHAALKKDQPAFDVHVFPFRMTEENMGRHAGSRWIAFWQDLKEGYDLFKESHVPPRVSVVNGNYVFTENTNPNP
jgi:murein L,D-transpeptidase YafK